MLTIFINECHASDPHVELRRWQLPLAQQMTLLILLFILQNAITEICTASPHYMSFPWEVYVLWDIMQYNTISSKRAGPLDKFIAQCINVTRVYFWVQYSSNRHLLLYILLTVLQWLLQSQLIPPSRLTRQYHTTSTCSHSVCLSYTNSLQHSLSL